MNTIVASWDHSKEKGEIHLNLDSRFFDKETRRSMAQKKVEELEAQFDPDSVEVMLVHARSLDDFKTNDPRFLP